MSSKKNNKKSKQHKLYMHNQQSELSEISSLDDGELAVDQPRMDMISNLKKWVPDDPKTLSLTDALAIKNFKRRSTFRALTQEMLGYECQMTGRDLARDAACRILEITLEDLYSFEFGVDKKFDSDHESVLGGFYWWE